MPKILVIDDDQDLTELIQFALTNAAYEVFVSNNPHEGIEMAFDTADFSAVLPAQSCVKLYLHPVGLQLADPPPLGFRLRRQSQHRSDGSFPPGRSWRSRISSAIMQGFVLHVA